MNKQNQLKEINNWVLEYYQNWCNERDAQFHPLQGLENYTLNELIDLTDYALNDVPIEVDYDIPYYFSVLQCVFPAILKAPGKLDNLGLRRIFTYARIFLNAGAYQECIYCCNICFRSEYDNILSAELLTEILFAQSKAYRNIGRYQDALDKLWQALEHLDSHQEISYLMGAALMRIGKVYSEYLMMFGVSICFLQEARDRLQQWLHADNPTIRQYVEREYAICLDEIGQYWRGTDNPEQAADFFVEAKKYNSNINRISGSYRNQAHLIAANFKEMRAAKEKGQLRDTAQVYDMIHELQQIIRKLLDDRDNQKGAAIRLVLLAQLQAFVGEKSDAIASLAESNRLSRLYQDDKTLVKAKIAELQYGIYEGEVARADLFNVLNLAERCNFYNYEISLNNLAIEAIECRRMYSADMLPCLRKNHDLYLCLSEMAQQTISRITNHSLRSEFSYLSKENNTSLLEYVVKDYNWFIKEMNHIINRLLKITEDRSEELTSAVITEAKMSLATGVLHDLKHILTTEDGTATYLDTVLKALRGWTDSIPDKERKQLIRQIHMVNENLKNKIYPSILEATRVPQDFHQQINIHTILSALCRQKPEEYHNVDLPVYVECPENLILEYNESLFANLMKELLRNAIDYQKEDVEGYYLVASDSHGQVILSVLTGFQKSEDADMAYKSIEKQLTPQRRSADAEWHKTETPAEDGYGITLLRNFMRSKTGGAATAKPKIGTASCRERV